MGGKRFDSGACETAAAIVNKALELGASMAGICSVGQLKNAPSFQLAPRLKPASAGTAQGDSRFKPGEVMWPEGYKSALIIALAHPESKPELDWWINNINPPGNRILIRIIRELMRWVESGFDGMKAAPLHYHTEKGGTFLKDAAVLAGLGAIGRNNLLITPRCGPRVRLRAMLLSASLPAAGPIDFDPCRGCRAPCLSACPSRAFDKIIYSAGDLRLDNLPGIDGRYDRGSCNSQMLKDIEAAEPRTVKGPEKQTEKVIKYCRRCELSCPAGTGETKAKKAWEQP